MNILSYARLIVVYNYNLLHVLQESDHDKETFRTTFNQRMFNNRHRMRSRSLPVAANVKDQFDPPLTFQEFFTKMWFRTGYYYDRTVAYPFHLATGTVHTYKYDPYGSHFPVKSIHRKESNNSLGNPNLSDHESLKVQFVPKPYVITESLKKKLSSEIQNDEDNNDTTMNNINHTNSLITECPVLSGLFNDQNVEPNIEQKLPITKDIDTIKSEKVEPSVEKSSNSIFYKIKIKRKNNNNKPDFKDHPTYARYDLVSQAIKNIIPQPNYLPDGTIGPNMIRFSWHCCAHFDKETGTGGSSGGTMRFAQEFNDLGNTGLTTTKSYLDQVHEQFPWMSFADLYTFAGCVAVEAIGGPKIEWKPGRTDCSETRKVPPMGRLPLATKDYRHIQAVFYDRLGFNAQETVALIGGGHGIGGCHARYSGFNGIWTKAPFKWDNDFFKVLINETWSLGTVPETGIEQYYNDDKSLMMLNTDMELLRFPDFKRWVEIYANDANFFDQQFALAYAKLLELGVIRDDDGIQRVKI